MIIEDIRRMAHDNKERQCLAEDPSETMIEKRRLFHGRIS